MPNTKIVLIGAASASFGPASLLDAIHTEALRGSTIVLVDLDAGALDVMTRFARRLNEVSGAGLVIESTTDRTQALPGADFVVSSFAIRRNELWRKDWEIPLKHGIKQVLGENGGPGGLSHACRNIPILLSICRDMERLCPEAWLINFSNPESRMCLAVSKHSPVKCVGLCHGVFSGTWYASRIMGLDQSELSVTAAGINHFQWFVSIRRKSNGEDLYPLLREKSREYDPTFMPLSRKLMDDFGLFPSPGDNHIGEYIGWAWDIADHSGWDFEGTSKWRDEQWERIVKMAEGDESIVEYAAKRSGELAFEIIRSMVTDSKDVMAAVNIPNHGCITNIPGDAIVEVPAMVGASGIHGLCVGDLPLGIAAMCSTQIGVQKLVVEAAVTGSWEIALQAMLADPVVDDYDSAVKCLDELLATHAPYLPQFPH